MQLVLNIKCLAIEIKILQLWNFWFTFIIIEKLTFNLDLI